MTTQQLTPPVSAPPSPRKPFADITHRFNRSHSAMNLASQAHDPLVDVRRKALPLAFINESDTFPGIEKCRQLDALIKHVAQHFNAPTPQTDTIRKVALLQFPNKTMAALMKMDKNLLEQSVSTWNQCLRLIKTLNQPQTIITTELQDCVYELLSGMTQFNQHYETWVETQKQQLCGLYFDLEMQIRTTQNHPDLVVHQISKGVQQLQQDVHQMVLFIDPHHGELFMAKKIDLFNAQWDTMKWVVKPGIERARDIWLNYASTGRIQLPSIPWASIGFHQVDEAISDNHSLKLAAAEATLTALVKKLDETIPDSIIAEFNNQVDHYKTLTDAAEQRSYFNHIIQHMCTTLVSTMRSHAPTIDFKSKWSKLQTLFHVGANETLRFALKFIFYYGDELAQFQLKHVLERQPALAQKKAIHLEQQFFKKRPISHTHQWIADYLKGTTPTQYYPTFGRKLLATTMLDTCLADAPPAVENLPDILRLDTTRLTRFHDEFNAAIARFILEQSSNYFVSQLKPGALPKQWAKQFDATTPHQDLMDWVAATAGLSEQQTQAYKQMILDNQQPSSTVRLQAIAALRPRLSAAIRNPGMMAPHLKRFPVPELNSLLDYLWLVHEPLFSYHNQQFIRHELLGMLTGHSPITEFPGPFNAIQQPLKRFHGDLRRTAKALATMRVTRQYAMARFQYLDPSTGNTHVEDDIKHRLQPLLKELFQMDQSSPRSSLQVFNRHLIQIATTYHQDLANNHRNQLIQTAIDVLKKPQLTLKNAPSILLHVWDEFMPIHHAAQTMTRMQKEQLTEHMKTHHQLPNWADHFEKLNARLNELYNQPTAAISYKFNSKQFKMPRHLCQQELVQICASYIIPRYKTTPPPLDDQTVSRFGTTLRYLMQQIKHTIENNPEEHVLPRHLRSGR